jgi:hypothetical protein
MTMINEAGWDRVLRVAAGVVLLYVGWSALSGSTLGIALGIVAFLPLLTGILGWCPAYSLVGIHTRRDDRAPTDKLFT